MDMCILHLSSTIKLPILKKGEYDIWAMKMEHYLSHTDYPIWEVIQKGNGPVSVSTNTNGVIKVLLKFGGNDESKKMQKYILKQQFEGFSVSNSEGLHKGYDRFQSLLSQLEIHGAGVSTEYVNQKFLRVFESDIKGSTGSSSSAQNVAFVSSESTSSTNDVSTAYEVSTSSSYNSQWENSSSYTDEVMYSFFANQSSGPHLDHEDLEQLDEFDLEEMDLKWQVAMISMRLKKFYKKTGRKLYFDAKEPIGFNKTKEEPKALVTLDGEGVDCTDHAENKQENFALMAYSNSCSNTEDNPQRALKNKGIVDSGYSRHMTGNKAYLAEYQDYNGGTVAFGGSKGYITGKGKIKAGKLDFKVVCFMKELQHFNLFSVS
ncbi:hypothetical protein Tco_1277811 [Tanacetum coccineum]